MSINMKSIQKTEQSNREKREARWNRQSRAVKELFNTPHLMASENPRQYKALIKTLNREMPTTSVLGQYRNAQIANAMMMAFRSSRLQVGLLKGESIDVLTGLLIMKYDDYFKRHKIARNYYSEIEELREESIRIVTKLGITDDMIESLAFVNKSEAMVLFDNMRAHNEQVINDAGKNFSTPVRAKKSKKNESGNHDTQFQTGSRLKTARDNPKSDLH